MLNFFRKTFNSVSYWILITFSIVLMAGSTFVGIYYAVSFGSKLGANVNHFLATIYEMWNLGKAPVIQDWLARLIFAVPFIFLGIFGLVILLLTQRTSNSNTENRKLRHQIKLLSHAINSEYSKWNIKELQEAITNAGYKYRKKANKIELIELIENIEKK